MKKYIKSHYLSALVIIIGILVLFFFPEPETNFLAYAGTALFFIILAVFIVFWGKNNK